MKIFSSNGSLSLSYDIIDELNNLNTEDEQFKLGDLSIDRFSDGEILPIFKESIRDEDVYFIQTTNTSDSIIETLLIIDAAKRSGCKTFTLVAPFMGYSRQDKTDHLRSSIGSKMIADVLEKVGMSKLITIDLHASSIQGFYNVPVIHLNGNKVFIDYIKSLKMDNMCILAPDQGAVKRASDFCKAFPESTFAMINKKRIKPNEIHSMEIVGDVAGKNVIIVDDMIDTGGTLNKAAKLIMEQGALSVRAVATHGVLSGAALYNIENSELTEVLVSDSIRHEEFCGKKIKFVGCSKLIAKSIQSIRLKKSINEINAI